MPPHTHTETYTHSHTHTYTHTHARTGTTYALPLKVMTCLGKQTRTIGGRYTKGETVTQTEPAIDSQVSIGISKDVIKEPYLINHERKEK